MTDPYDEIIDGIKKAIDGLPLSDHERREIENAMSNPNWRQYCEAIQKNVRARVTEFKEQFDRLEQGELTSEQFVEAMDSAKAKKIRAMTLEERRSWDEFFAQSRQTTAKLALDFLESRLTFSQFIEQAGRSHDEEHPQVEKMIHLVLEIFNASFSKCLKISDKEQELKSIIDDVLANRPYIA